MTSNSSRCCGSMTFDSAGLNPKKLASKRSASLMKPPWRTVIMPGAWKEHGFKYGVFGWKIQGTGRNRRGFRKIIDEWDGETSLSPFFCRWFTVTARNFPSQEGQAFLDPQWWDVPQLLPTSFSHSTGISKMVMECLQQRFLKNPSKWSVA